MIPDRPALVGAAAILAALAVSAAATEDLYPFIPSGGRTLLAEKLAADDPDTLADVVSRTATREEWAGWARDHDPALAEKETETFAAYAALNFPMTGDATALDFDELVAALPADGKDLAVAQCQFCHSFFTGYLMQRRDETSWLGTFKAPFHKEIPMSEVERATFAAYSAINMPLDIEDVPPELRF